MPGMARERENEQIVVRDDTNFILGDITDLAAIGSPWFVQLQQELGSSTQRESLWSGASRLFDGWGIRNNEWYTVPERYAADIQHIIDIVENQIGKRFVQYEFSQSRDVTSGIPAARIRSVVSEYPPQDPNDPTPQDEYDPIRRAYADTFIFLPNKGEFYRPVTFSYAREVDKAGDGRQEFSMVDGFADQRFYDNGNLSLHIILPGEERTAVDRYSRGEDPFGPGIIW